MLTCKDASRLASCRQDRPLSFRERWGLRIHLWMCGNCRRIARQTRLMRMLLRKLAYSSETAAADEQLSSEARTRIRGVLDGQWEHRTPPS